MKHEHVLTGPSTHAFGYEAGEGIAVIIRFAIVAAAVLVCAACAKEGETHPMGLGYRGQFEGQIDSRHAQLGSLPANTTKVNRISVPNIPKMRQTLGGKVLSAIALERITGRKPDPRRFNELH